MKKKYHQDQSFDVSPIPQFTSIYKQSNIPKNRILLKSDDAPKATNRFLNSSDPILEPKVVLGHVPNPISFKSTTLLTCKSHIKAFWFDFLIG